MSRPCGTLARNHPRMILLKRKPVRRITAAAVAVVCVGSLAWTLVQLQRQVSGAAHRETEDALSRQLGMPVRLASMRRLSTRRTEFHDITIQSPDGRKPLLTCPFAAFTEADEADRPALLTLRGPQLLLGGPDWDASTAHHTFEHLGRLGERPVRIEFEDASFHLPLGRVVLHVEEASGCLTVQPGDSWPIELRCGRVNGHALARPAEVRIDLRTGVPRLVAEASVKQLIIPAAGEAEGAPARFSGSIEFSGPGDLTVSGPGRLTDPGLAEIFDGGWLTEWAGSCDMQFDSLRWVDDRLEDCTLSGRAELGGADRGEAAVHLASLRIRGRRIQELLLAPMPSSATRPTTAPSDAAARWSGLPLGALAEALGLGACGGSVDLTCHTLHFTGGRLEEMDLEVRSNPGGGRLFLSPAAVRLLNPFFLEGEVDLREGLDRLPVDRLALRVVVRDGQVRYHSLGEGEDRVLRLTVPNIFEPDLWPSHTIRQDGDPPRPVPLSRAKPAWLEILNQLDLPAVIRDLFKLPQAEPDAAD